jgi:hypothetical protein
MELTYARWLAWGTRASLTVLVACFLAYALLLVEPLVPLQELIRLWTLPVDAYLAASGAPTGWHWLRVVGKGDYLNLVGIAMVALVTLICYVRVVPLLIRSGERLYAGLAVLQILVLVAAASGVLAGGH